MNRFPYSNNPLKAFDEMEADALLLERLADEREASANAIERINGNPNVVRGNRLIARRLRSMASCLGFMAGRVDRLHLLREPVRRSATYGQGFTP